jgi:hypothetical protein
MRNRIRYLEQTVKWFFKWYSGGVQLGPLGTAATNRPIVPAPGDFEDGKIGKIFSKGNRGARRKLAPVPLCPPQSPHAARTRTRATAVGSQRLSNWATARPIEQTISKDYSTKFIRTTKSCWSSGRRELNCNSRWIQTKRNGNKK